MQARRFPLDELGQVELARRVLGGLAEHPGEFSGIDAVALQDKLAAVTAAEAAQQDAAAQLRQATAGKLAARDALARQLRIAVRQAEALCMSTPVKLVELGWRERRQGGTLEPPAAARNLTARRNEDGSVTLAWKKQPGGGPVRNWSIERRSLAPGGPGPWLPLTFGYDNLITLAEEPAGKQEYRVSAANTAGKSGPSNSAVVY